MEGKPRTGKFYFLFIFYGNFRKPQTLRYAPSANAHLPQMYGRPLRSPFWAVHEPPLHFLPRSQALILEFSEIALSAKHEMLARMKMETTSGFMVI